MRYKPLPDEADIGPEESLIQAAYALDAAASMAQKKGDVEGMLAAGAMWIKFGEAVQGFAVEEVRAAEILGGKEPKMQLGFQGAPVDEITIEGEVDE